VNPCNRLLPPIFAMLSLSFAAFASGALAQAPVTYNDPYTRVGRPYFDAGIGWFQPQSTNHLANQDGEGVGIVGGGYRVSPGFAWGAEITGFSQKVDTPEGARATSTRVEGRSRLESEGLAVGFRWIIPASDRMEPYLGGGIGWYQTWLRVRSDRFFRHDTVAEEKSNDFGAHVLAGFDYWVRPKIAVGAELRYLRLNARFDSLLQGTEHAGGTFLMFRYRQAF
jgi:opacity protein-like surface antigen